MYEKILLPQATLKATAENISQVTFKWCLLGRFFTCESPPSMEDTGRVLSEKCNLTQFPEIFLKFDSTIMAFVFDSEEDAKQVMAGSPWNINGVLLVLKDDWKGVDIKDIDFHVTTFWVQILGIPLFYYSTENAMLLARSIGKYMASDIDPARRSFWIKVEMDLRYPFSIGSYHNKEGQEPRWIQFKYKGLGDFCYNCGMLDHTRKSCNNGPMYREMADGLNVPCYGPWLDADFKPHSEFRASMLLNHDRITEDDETLPYRQFFVELNVSLEYDRHDFDFDFDFDADRRKRLPWKITTQVAEHCFRIPCTSLTSDDGTEGSASWKIISEMLDEKVPWKIDRVKLERFPRKMLVRNRTDLKSAMLDFLRYIEICYSGRKWIPVCFNITKQVTLPDGDFEAYVQDMNEDNKNLKIDKALHDLAKREAQTGSDLSSLTRWKKKISRVLEQIGGRDTVDLERTAIRTMQIATELFVSALAGPKPAMPTAVRELEHVKVRGADLDLLDPCVICMEEILLGSEATRMPCSHIFHTQCIQEWLRTGHTCPLCCFKLPTYIDH